MLCLGIVRLARAAALADGSAPLEADLDPGLAP